MSEAASSQVTTMFGLEPSSSLRMDERDYRSDDDGNRCPSNASVSDSDTDSDSDVEMGDSGEDETDFEDDTATDDGLIEADDVPTAFWLETQEVVFAANVTGADVTDFAAANMEAVIERIFQRDNRRERNGHKIIFSDKEGHTRVDWLPEERTAFWTFVKTRGVQGKERVLFPVEQRIVDYWRNERPDNARIPIFDNAIQEDVLDLAFMFRNARFVEGQQHSKATQALVSGKSFFAEPRY